jgi:ribose transport system ATP-binding protein
MADYIFEIKNLSKSYEGIPILKNASLQICQGEILGLIGKNASAKTTLVKTISGVIQPDSGEIYIDGILRKIKNPKTAYRFGIGAIHENSELLKNFTVAENIFFGFYRHTSQHGISSNLGIVDGQHLKKQAKDLCDKYELDIDVTRKSKHLTAAQQQMVYVLHAVARKTRILWVDECFSVFDNNEINKMKRIFNKARESGMSIIIVSQNPQIIDELADSVIFITDGVLSQRYTPEELRNIKFSEIADFYKDQPFPKLAIKKGPVFFSCRNICYKDVLSEISFDVYQGEILGILGVSGAGKSTLARIIGGDIQSTLGVMYLNGSPISVSNPSRARKYKISLISDDTRGLISHSNLITNVSLNNYKPASNHFFPFLINNKKLGSLCKKVIDKLGVTYHTPYQNVCHLSAGNQKKVAFSRSIFSGAQLFLLDEPTLRVDTAGRIQIYNIMNELVREGKSIIFFTSDIDEALGMCDRLLILRGGKIAGEYLNSSVSAKTIYDNLYKLN